MGEQKGDLEEMWERAHGPTAVKRRERECMRYESQLRRLRKHGYASWICSLKPGDEVVLRFPWLDKDVPRGERHPGWVREVRDRRFWVDYLWFGGDAGIEHRTKRFHLPYAGGDAYCRVEHPTREVIYSGDLGFVFRDEWEDWKRRRKAWKTRRLNAAALLRQRPQAA